MSHVLFYAKYSVDRKKNVKLLGTYFGDVGNYDQLKTIGKEIVLSDPQFIVVPKIYFLNDTIDSIALDAQEDFEKFGENMQEEQEK